MNDQKIENILNLALDATENERERSGQLGVGFNPVDNKWELIVKYNGSLEKVAEALPGTEVEEFSNEYAILVVPEPLIDALASFSEIEYIEKPKSLNFAVVQARAASCINPVQTGARGLTGKGTIVAIIDSGIDYYHEDFRNQDGTTRILEMWDQSLDRVFTREEINEALSRGSRSGAEEVVPSRDLSGHGTAVAGIAAGNGRESGGRNRGVAYESDLLVVRLGTPRENSFPRTTELMKALDYVVRRGLSYGEPVAVNLSFGNSYGSHDGTSLLETYIDDISNYWKTVIVTGTGNEGSSRGHTSGRFSMGKDTEIELSVADYETGFGVQLWKLYTDIVEIAIISPGGLTTGVISDKLGPQRIRFGETTVLLYYGKPSPYSQAQEIYLDFIPDRDYVQSGIWKIRLTPRKVAVGQYDLWLPGGGVLNRSTRFLKPEPNTTLTIPSTAFRVISVSAYDDSYPSFADFSGRGFTRLDTRVKPDLAAPGVGILAPRAGGGYEAVTGTSFAAPFVSGSAALLMQWGIVENNDPFLYGEKIKAYLIRGAKPLPGENVYPNERLGFGILCLEDSFPL